MARDPLSVGIGRHYARLTIRDRAAGFLSLPMVVVRGRSDHPTLLVTAGSHPTEYAGIEAALRLSRRLNPRKIRGRVIIVPFVNLIGFNARTPGGCPEDSVDIFGAFPGYEGGSVSYSIAHGLFEKVVRQADYVVDLHGGELNESESLFLAWHFRVGNAKVDRASERLARMFGPDYLLDASRIWINSRRSALPKGLLAYEAAKLGKPAIIGEGGGSGKVGEFETKRLFDGLLRVCRGVGITKGEVKEKASTKVHGLTLLTSNYDGLLYCKVGVGDRVSRGDTLAEVRNWEGLVLQRVTAPCDGIIEITVNWMPIRSGEYVLAMVRY
jgi:predicted deacylase